MAPKHIATLILLTFVAASVVTLVRKERRPPSAVGTHPDVAHAPGRTAESGAQVVVYYFHGSMRCTTCRTIEALAKESIEGSFAAELATGRLAWREVDVEAPGNDHFVADFELSTRSVVVARYHNGERQRWKRLDAVWQLVGDKPAFLELVRSETSAMLKEAGT